MTVDPHHREADAAIAALHEHTPSRRIFAVGDHVSGRTNGLHWSGRIEWVQDDGELVINDGRSLIGRNPQDVTH